MGILYKDDGTPFANENSAKSGATRKGLTEYKVVAVSGGFGVEFKDRCEDLASPIDTTVETEENNCDEEVEVELVEPEGNEEGITEIEDIKPTDIDVGKGGEIELSARDRALAVTWTKPTDAFAMYDQYRDPDFVYKWANPKGKLGARIDELTFEGWRVDDVMYKNISKLLLSAIDRVGQGLGTETMVFGHILMRLPRKAARIRNAEYQKRAKAGLKEVQEKHNKVVGDCGVGKMTVTM